MDLDEMTPTRVDLLDVRRSDGAFSAHTTAIHMCRVNGGEPARFVGAEITGLGLTTVTIEVPEERVRVNYDLASVQLDGREVLVEDFGYRPSAIGRVRLVLIVGDLRVETTGATDEV